MKKSHVNIPIFIPHLGCPNMCVFCNQRTISGVCSFVPEMARDTVESHLATVRGSGAVCEIAFFGGSFTGIDRGLMISLLDLAEEYVERGEVAGIRMSTRPDYISEEIIEILRKYTVSAVELGIQSMSDDVLQISKRGHTADISRSAVRMLCDAGFKVVGQMMVGLPGATREDELSTAHEICRLGCSASRIYPTIVFRETELSEMMARGEYVPLTLDEAVSRAADVLEVFLESDVECIRIGLCESENLHSDETYVAGPVHPSIGELVYGEIYYKKMCNLLDGADSRDEVIFTVSLGETSMAVGQKKRNVQRIIEKYGIGKVHVTEKDGLPPYTVELS